jgi:hypothetical protein
MQPAHCISTVTGVGDRLGTGRPVTEVVADIADEVDAHPSLGENPLAVVALEAVVIAAAGDRLER